MKEKIEYVTQRTVSCNGDSDIDGHPKVYLEIDQTNEVICPYCSKKFVYKENL
jgi:uncharacterized Zn-finger protein